MWKAILHVKATGHKKLASEKRKVPVLANDRQIQISKIYTFYVFVVLEWIIILAIKHDDTEKADTEAGSVACFLQPLKSLRNLALEVWRHLRVGLAKARTHIFLSSSYFFIEDSVFLMKYISC